MVFTVHILGCEVLHLSTQPEPPDDTARDLSGGTTGYDRINAGPTDHYMGFANGRKVE